MFFIILFTIFYTGLYYRKGENPPALQNAFTSAGAKFVNSEVYVWSDIGEQYKSMESLLEVADQLSIKIGILKNDDFSKKTVSNDSIDKTEIRGSTTDGKVVCISAQISKSKSDIDKSIISIDVTNESAQLDINDTANLLEENFESFGLNPKVNTCIIGCFDGKLDYGEMNRISRIILEDTKAQNINRISDKNLISVSAYSPLIDNNIEVQGKRINMNLALRYNAYEDKTYIWLATPVITIEY